MNLTPCIYLSFDGRCEAAFRFYAERLGGTIESMFTWGNSPMAAEAPAGWEAKIMHAAIRIGGAVIMGSDVPADAYERPKGFQMMLAPADPEETERLFAALAENGTVAMPLQETFWAVRFGVVVDQFGIPWSFNCEQTPERAA